MAPLQHVIDDLRRAVERSTDGHGSVASEVESCASHLEAINSELEIHRELFERIATALERIADAQPSNNR